jgi:hypothetical protein
MKNILLLSFLFSSISLMSQNYASMLSDSSAWIYISADADGGQVQYRFPRKYEISGDTIVSGVFYKKISRWYQSALIGGMREDTLGRVFFKEFDISCGLDSTQERLIFDYSLEVGDTLKVETGDFCNPTEFPLGVVQVDSIETEFGEMRKRLELESIYNDLQTTYIIEGIGSNIDLLDFINGIEDYDAWHYASYLICHHLKSGENYINPDRPSWTVCFLDPATSVESPNVEKLQISPNPVSSFLEIKGLENITQSSSIEIFNLNGIQVFQSDFLQKEIDVSNFPKGIYFLLVKNEDQVWLEKFVKM